MKGIRMLISKNDLVLSNEEVYVKLFVIFKDKNMVQSILFILMIKKKNYIMVHH